MAKIPPISHLLLQAWRSHLAFGRNVRSDRPLDGDVCICKIVIQFGGIFAIVFPAWSLLWLPTAQAGWRNISNLSQREVLTNEMGHPV